MSDYTKLIERLRNNRIEDNCHDCSLGYNAFAAANAIEELVKELDRLKRIMRENGIVVLPSRYPGGKSEWNV